MRSSRASSDKRRGQAVIESSLILLIFIPVLIGILDFGQFLYFHQSLSERARAGARYAAVHTFDATKIANYTLYNDDTGTTNGATALLPKVNDPSGSATVGNATITATLSNAGTDDACVTVTIGGYPYNFFSPFLSKSTWYRTVTATVPYEIGR